MRGAGGGVVWPLCHVPCCPCSTSWSYQGPLASLALGGKLPESTEWGQGGGCAAAGAQFLCSDCRRPDCSLLACEIARFLKKTWSVWSYTDLICSEDHSLRILSTFKSTAQSLFYFCFFHKAWNQWISCKWTLQWWGANCIVYHIPEFLK